MRTPRPPYRAAPTQGGPGDNEIAAYWNARWESQTIALLPRDRQIDENVRMLLGSQWLIWNPLLQRHFDISEWFRDAAEKERLRPVFNRILPWFVITHSRMTENQPILTFLPGADADDADVAEAHDRLFKWTFRKMGMPDAIARLQAWKIVAGSAGLLFYINPSAGDWEPVTGPAMVPIIANGTVIDQVQQVVPLLPNGQPAMGMTPQGQPVPFGEPKMKRRGQLCVETLSPLEYRGEWGTRPWHEKRWHAIERWLTTEEVYQRWGVEIEPGVEAQSSMIAQRVLLGNGLYMPAAEPGVPSGYSATAAKDMCRVRLFFEAPSGDGSPFAEQPDYPGGRYTVIAHSNQVLYDGPRPLSYPFTSPLHVFDFLRLPGRHGGSSPQNGLNSPQRHLNRQKAYELQHAHLNAHPVTFIDKSTGITREQWTNEAGAAFVGTSRTGVEPIRYIQPPRLSEDVWRIEQNTKRDLDELGMLLGTSGEPLSPDQSGEAIRELRFNADRYLGASLRGDVEELGRIGYTWMPHFKLLYPMEQALRIIGEDDAPMVISIYPEMFDANTVQIIPDAESMLPESRQERQQRALAWYKDGLLGVPGTYEAMAKYWEIARFPHYSRFTKPGGEDARTAERENSELVRGAQAASIPLYPWYSHEIHIAVHEQVMKSHRFKTYDPMVRAQFVAHWMQHKQALAQLQAQMMARQAPQPGGGAAGGSGGGEPADSGTSVNAGPDTPQPPTGMPAQTNYPTTPSQAPA